MKPIDQPCPCGTGQSYQRCCGLWHAGKPAKNAEQLMRARYAAFVLRDEQYLLETWHPPRRPLRIDFLENQTWLGLTVVATRAVAADFAEVEFIARFVVGHAKVMRHHERSRFIREGDKWFYIDGLLA